MNKAKYGYIAVTADFLHIGHLRFLNKAKKQVDRLIVGVMTDKCCYSYKGKNPIMNQGERSEIVRALACVDKTIYQDCFEFPPEVLKMKEVWKENFIIFDSEEHKRKNADVIIPRTSGISSSLIKKGIDANFDFSKCPL